MGSRHKPTQNPIVPVNHGLTQDNDELSLGCANLTPMGKVDQERSPPAPDHEGECCLRRHDEGLTTRRTCLIGLVSTYIVVLGGFIATVTLAVTLNQTEGIGFKKSTGLVGMGSPEHSLLLTVPLVFAIIVTFCSESVGLLHATSLRWALWREGRLKFNTNLRLMTQASSSLPNHWIVNLYFMLVTALAYAASGQIFSVYHPTQIDPGFIDDANLLNLGFSVQALALMVFGLFSQTIIATWSFFSIRHHVLTWSNNPLNNALTCAHQGLEHHLDRSLLSYHKYCDTLDARLQGREPQLRQSSMAESRQSAIIVVILLWAIVISTLILASCTYGLGKPSQSLGAGGLLQQGKAITFPQSWSSSANTRWTGGMKTLAFRLATQLLFTLSLHSTELLVNATRDERAWRKATRWSATDLHPAEPTVERRIARLIRMKGKWLTSAKGAQVNSNAVKDACSSWETIVLFISKFTVHWSFNESLQINFNNDGSASVMMWANALLLVVALIFSVAVLATFLCFRRFRGPQPVAYGHLQTLVDLVDDWGIERESLYWGDKGHLTEFDGKEIRRAGTAGKAERVSLIRMDARYR